MQKKKLCKKTIPPCKENIKKVTKKCQPFNHCSFATFIAVFLPALSVFFALSVTLQASLSGWKVSLWNFGSLGFWAPRLWSFLLMAPDRKCWRSLLASRCLAEFWASRTAKDLKNRREKLPLLRPRLLWCSHISLRTDPSLTCCAAAVLDPDCATGPCSSGRSASPPPPRSTPARLGFYLLHRTSLLLPASLRQPQKLSSKLPWLCTRKSSSEWNVFVSQLVSLLYAVYVCIVLISKHTDTNIYTAY